MAPFPGWPGGQRTHPWHRRDPWAIAWHERLPLVWRLCRGVGDVRIALDAARSDLERRP